MSLLAARTVTRNAMAMRQAVGRRSMHVDNVVGNNTPFSYQNKAAFAAKVTLFLGAGFAIPFVAVGYQVELSPPHPPVDHDIGVRPVNMSSASSTAGGQPQSRVSTPATDVSPPRTPEFVLPPPTPETLRRRAQSDRASSEIGARMLKGWAMLSEECMNDDCWAIPLVRPPRARPGAQPDPRKVHMNVLSAEGSILRMKTESSYSNPAQQANPYPARGGQKRLPQQPQTTPLKLKSEMFQENYLHAYESCRGTSTSIRQLIALGSDCVFQPNASTTCQLNFFYIGHWRPSGGS
ncbi:Cytochrome C oxidase subunit VIIc [Ceratobasidium sp. AG-Ba]|nr:Cytochrome C oxidase subunit VIIc [Ceratobasidium sp. AG-Ba]